MSNKRKLQAYLPSLALLREPIDNPPLSPPVDQPKRPLHTQRMREALALLTDVTTLVIDKDLVAIDGWLSPNGDLYACRRRTHHDLVVQLGFKLEKDIEDAGWCKLSDCEWLVASYYLSKPLTRDQKTLILNWYDKNGFDKNHILCQLED